MVFSAGRARADDARTVRVGNEYAGPVEYVDEPFSESMRPVRGHRERLANRTAGELQVAQDGFNVGSWCGGRDARAADFRHCGDLGKRQGYEVNREGEDGRTTKNVFT